MLVFQPQLISMLQNTNNQGVIEQEMLHEFSSSYYNGNGHSSWEAVSTSHKPLQDTVKVSLLGFQKDSLDTVGFRTFKTFSPLLIIKQYYHHHTQSGQVQVLESLELAGWSDKTDAVSVHSELFR